MSASRFRSAVGVVAVAAAVGGAAVPLVVGAGGAFRGAIVGSGLLAAVFAGYNAYSVVVDGVPRFAASVVAGVIGLWLIAAPLTYDVGTAATAGAQTAGMLLATTAGYAALDAVESGFPAPGSVPAAADEPDD